MKKFNKCNKKALVLFSGGKDSLLVTLRLLDDGYEIYLVTYENGCGLKVDNVNNTINRLKRKYGKEKIKNLGIKNISGIFREFIYPFYNYTSSYIKEKFGNISISQFNCLACRTSMYIASIILCKKNNINSIFDGARKSQLFAIEQSEMLDRFKKIFNENNIIIDYLLENELSDWNVKNELLVRGLVPKTIEPQCLLGVPLHEKDINKEMLDATINVYENYLKPKIEILLSKYEKISFSGELI